ncbi:MAG TPA: pilus assembly protein TadG-related protein [Pyrinomonadaceae bacterium]|nr:pilus assembly protein TadG-related protein [Pyrinomonadaceae bacterium]
MKNRSNKQAGNKRERGSILATSAIGMLAILLAVGLGVDISRFYLTKAELQNATDAAALAAVSALDTSPAGIHKAVDRAVASMNKYDFRTTDVAFPRANVLFAKNLNDDPYMSEAMAAAEATAKDIRFVKVTTDPSAVPVSFAVSVLGSSQNQITTATAGYSVPLNRFCNFLPVSVIDYGDPIVPFQTYTFRASSGTSVSPGNYQILAVAGEGGKDVRIGLAAGVDRCASAGEEYAVDTKPGVTAGAVRQGLNTRFDEYQTSQVNPDDMPPDSNIKEGIEHDDYIHPERGLVEAPRNAPPGIYGRRLVVIPIVKQEEYDSGRNVVKFNRFGLFFLKTKVGSGSGGELEAEYVGTPQLGQGGFDPNGAPTNGLMAVPVLYK